jgi:hypothetical protein
MSFNKLLPDEIDERLREIVVAAETSATPEPIVSNETSRELQAATESDALEQLRKAGIKLDEDFPELPKPQPPSDKHDETFGGGMVKDKEPHGSWWVDLHAALHYAMYCGMEVGHQTGYRRFCLGCRRKTEAANYFTMGGHKDGQAVCVACQPLEEKFAQIL